MPLHDDELRSAWIPVATLPEIGKVNGYWDSIPVIIAIKPVTFDGVTHGRVVGAFFTYEGGDEMDKDEEVKRTPVPNFHTDEGLGYHDVTHWQYMPKHPKDLK